MLTMSLEIFANWTDWWVRRRSRQWVHICACSFLAMELEILVRLMKLSKLLSQRDLLMDLLIPF